MLMMFKVFLFHVCVMQTHGPTWILHHRDRRPLSHADIAKGVVAQAA